MFSQLPFPTEGEQVPPKPWQSLQDAGGLAAGWTLFPCDPQFPYTDQEVMKPPGAEHLQSMRGHAHRLGGPCRAGGPSSNNAVGVAWWLAWRASDKF
jgi:hypothetical protein